MTNGPLTALAGGGAYAYGSSNTFPTNTYNNNNYGWTRSTRSVFGVGAGGATGGVGQRGAMPSASASWTAPGSGGARSLRTR